MFLGGFVAIVVAMRLSAIRAVRFADPSSLARGTRRFRTHQLFANVAVLSLFIIGTWELNWGSTVHWLLGPIARYPLQIPGLVIGTFPAIAAWTMLAWSRYPVESTMREWIMAYQLNEGQPIHPMPSTARYVISRFRMDTLLLLGPILLLLAIRDVAAMAAIFSGRWIVQTESGQLRLSGGVDLLLHLVSIAIVFAVAPELLRRILHTRPLRVDALRNRLEEFSRFTRTRFAQLLQWHTDGTSSNAMVMGVLPPMRYVLLSDLLLETMNDREIEAVFAHETGHVRHHHMLWYGLFLLAFMMVFSIASAIAMQFMGKAATGWAMDSINLTVTTLVFLTTFSALSRLFERQADAYAVRALEAAKMGAHPLSVPVTGPAVDVFCSALARVAAVNNIPIGAFNPTHGSIRSRMISLHTMAIDPANTAAFDRTLFRVKLGIVLVLVTSLTVLVWLLPRMNVTVS